MIFNISSDIDPNKIFLVNRSELEGRIDSTSYKPSFNFSSKTFSTEKLAKVALINPKVSFGSLKNESEISFVPMETVSDKDGRITDMRVRKVSDSKGFTRFKEGDLIWAKITPCMQNGKSAVARDLKQGFGCGSTEFFVIRPKSTDVLLVDYIHFLLRDERVLNDAQNYFGGSAGQQRVSVEFLKNFKIPIPPIPIQEKIVSIINSAYLAKQQKESEAKSLLDSVDTYLLNQLGVTLPEQNNSLQNRIFTTRFSEVVGGRFDSYFHQGYFKSAFSSLKLSKYPILRIKDIAEKVTSGITPLSGGEAYTTKDEGIPFIRSGNIEISGLINFEDLIYLKPEIHNTTMKSSKVKYGDLMIAIVGATIGQVGIYLDDREANINQAIALVRIKDGLNRQFIKEVIKSSIGQLNLNRLKRPVARANINLEEISTMQIIIPPLEKQNEIASHIQAIRAKAKALQQEAAKLLDDAKKQVEQLIIGE